VTASTPQADGTWNRTARLTGDDSAGRGGRHVGDNVDRPRGPDRICRESNLDNHDRNRITGDSHVKRLILIAMSSLLLAAPLARAADEDSNYVIWGVGKKSCNSYSQARSQGKADEFRSYVAGYLTAYNAFMPETYNIAPGQQTDGVLAWLDDHCADSKTSYVADALHRFIEESHEAREKAAPGSGARWP
jgi:hypothetical protein